MSKFANCVMAGGLTMLLHGCASAPTVAPVAVLTLTPAQVATVRDGVRKALKDPDSAQFGDMIAGRDDKGILYVCGWVNAKNSMGGYTGEKRFAGNIAEHADPPTKKLYSVFVVTSLGGDQAADMVTKVACERVGLPIG